MAPRIHGALYPAPSRGLPMIVAIFKDGELAGCNIAANEAEGEAMIASAVAELQRLEVAASMPPAVAPRRPPKAR